MIATAGSDCVRLWQYNHESTNKFEPSIALEAVTKIRRGAFNFDATKLILLPGFQSTHEAQIIVVDIGSRDIVEFTGPSKTLPPKEIVASSVDTRFAAFTHGRCTMIWVYDTNLPGAPLLSIGLDNPNPPCLSPDLSCFVTGKQVYDLNIAGEFDENTAIPKETLRDVAGGYLTRSCFSGDGTVFGALLPNSLCVWNTTSGPWELQMKLKFNEDDEDEDGDEEPCYMPTINTLCFNPSKTALVAFYKDEGARIWSAATGEDMGFIRLSSSPYYGLFITTDDVIVVGSNSGIGLYDIHGQPLVNVDGRPLRLETTEGMVLGGTLPRNILL